MCGIIGSVQSEPFAAKELLERLRLLEYRGYDSYGYATRDRQRKDTGHIAILAQDAEATATSGIAHTRWATHGGVTVTNAHPHRHGKIALVHNGIIENYGEIASGETRFLSQTDTERLAARIDKELKTREPIDAVRAALAASEGIWAIAALIDGVDGVLVARSQVPLLVGKTPHGHVAASDARALPDAAELFSLEDGHVALLTAEAVTLQAKDGASVKPRWEKNRAGASEDRPDGHAMEYEILQTPALVAQELPAEDLGATAVTIIGCGSSANAARIAIGLAHSAARVTIASDYDPVLDASPLIIAVSQSGETADVIDAVRKAKTAGRRIVALVNAPHTTLTRIADTTIMLDAGEERCVAATKSVTLQVVALARMLGVDLRKAAVGGVRDAIRGRERIREMARDLAKAEHLFLIGRGSWWGLAQEAALKLKEVAYQHAEAVPAFELKHGPLALVTDAVPVIAFGAKDDMRLSSTIHEVEARAGQVTRLLFSDDATGVFHALVASQLLAYEIALLRGTPIDHPRNLAKSVTVY